MTYSNAAFVIPFFAIGYVLIVYGLIALAQRYERRGKPES